MLLEERFRRFGFLITLVHFKCPVTTRGTWLSLWTVQVRKGFLEDVEELSLEGLQRGAGRPSSQRNSISKAWGRREQGLLLRKSGCQPARKRKAQDFISFYIPISSSISPSSTPGHRCLCRSSRSKAWILFPSLALSRECFGGIHSAFSQALPAPFTSRFKFCDSSLLPSLLFRERMRLFSAAYKVIHSS